MSDNNKNLYYLDDLSKYKVSSDDSDVRGWDVIDVDNRRIGKVDGLLANKETERVVYLDVEVDHSLIEADHKVYDKPANEGMHEFINEEGDNHLIIPIGLVALDETNDKVISSEINHKTFSQTKRIRKGSDVDRNYELMVLNHYLPATTFDSFRSENKAHSESEGFYNRSEFKRPRNRI